MSNEGSGTTLRFCAPIRTEDNRVEGAVRSFSIRNNETRGKKYDTYLIILTDKRGKVIAMKTPSKWLLENLENLKNLPVGSFMDKTCTRVYPGRPKAELY